MWGAEPNRFVAAELADLGPGGRALDLACGEGRNAIWLARLGWQVTGVDFSGVALERAAARAGRAGVEVEWIEADVSRWQTEPIFSLVVVAYLHLGPESWRDVLELVAAALAPGGEALLVGHARENLERGWGGPQDPDILWDTEAIARSFDDAGLTVARAELVERPVTTPEGERVAIDTLVRVHRPVAERRR